jgi:hypothetical protein
VSAMAAAPALLATGLPPLNRRSVAWLQCTRAAAARARLGREHLPAAGPTDAVLGNWYVTLQPLADRNAFVYMSERTLLSFLMLEGERITPQKLSTSLVRGMIMVLEMDGHPPAARDRVLADYATGAFARATDFSLLGSLSNLALDYAACIDEDGGVARCDLGAIIHALNHRPSKRLDWRSPFEATAALLRTAAA